MTEVNPAERLTEDDRTVAAAEQFLARALLAQQARSAKPAPKFTGVCLNCEEKSLALFCEQACFEDYMRREGRG